MTSEALHGEMRPEVQLLLSCSRYRLEPHHQRLVRQLTSRPLDWDAVLNWGQAHGVLPLIHFHVGQQGHGPDHVRQRLQAVARETLVQNMVLTTEMCRLTRLLDEKGARFLWFKGPVAIETLPRDLGLRRYHDLDLLVDLEFFPHCLEILQREGYSPQFALPAPRLEQYFREWTELTLFHDTGTRVVDLHWQLIPECYSFAIPTRSVWSNVRHLELDGTSVPTLSVEDGLLYYCLHAAKHNWGQLKWLVDIAETARAHPEIDWREAWGRWSRVHNPYLVGVGLQLAADLLEAPIPRDVLERRPHDARFDRTYRAARHPWTMGDLAPPDDVTWLWQQPFYLGLSRASDRARRLYHVLLRPTPLEWQLVPLPARLSGLYHVLRPLRVLGRSCRRWWKRTD
jgi:hypothetical protein